MGTATIAANALIPAIRQTKSGVVHAVASRNLEKARSFAETHDIPNAFGSYEELLSDPEVDAVYIPLPVSMHAEWSLKAAEAGKPVLCEKPLTANVDDARNMMEVFQAKGLLLSEALMYRYHPLNRKAAEMVKQGAVGKPAEIRSRFMITSPAGDIRRDAGLGGGALLDVGCYCLSVQRFITGEEPLNVKASGIIKDGVDVNVSGTLHFPSGVLGSFSCGLNSVFDCSYEVIGSEGRIVVDRGAMCAWPGEAFTIKHWQGEHGDTYEEITIPEANHYVVMVEDFHAALLGEKPMEFPMEDTLRNMELINQVFDQLKD